MTIADSICGPFSRSAALVGVVMLIILALSMITTVAADEIVVKQGFFDGSLTVWNTPGPKWRNFGSITTYKKSSQYSFSAMKDQGGAADQSIKVRFNDGGHGNISGTFRFDLPLDEKLMVEIHQRFHSQQNVEQQLVRPAVERAVYMSGPLMSSKESASERRADLLKYIEDQVRFGVYQTVTKMEKVIDEVSGKEKTAARVELVNDHAGGIARQEKSLLDQLGIKTYSYNINGIAYEKSVEDQIGAQQKLAMDIQTAIARSKEAEQRAITTAKEGEASAAKAKWDQEVLKTTEVTKAEQEKAVALTTAQKEKEVALLAAQKEKAVAELAVQTADLKKKEQTLIGDGESYRARAMMQATGFMPERLAAWKEVALAQANQLGKQRQTPDIIMGGTCGGNNGGSSNLADLMSVSLAKQLNLSPLGAPAGK
jgi:hypothetical protein